MKKFAILFINIVLIIGSLNFTTSAATKNLCDELSKVNEFHQSYNIYNNPDPDLSGFIEREVKAGEMYSASTIIAASSMIYNENPNKYTVVKQPERNPFDTTSPLVIQKPYGEYICVPENEYVNFIKSRFNINDALINELRNFKVRNFSTFYDENGTPIFDTAKGTYIVPVIDDSINLKSPYRKFIGYVKNGATYDVYLNLATITDWQSVPDGKLENIDYYAEKYDDINPNGPGTIEKIRYYSITNDWMKYTVSYDGISIKYLSNVKVNSIPANLIRRGDIVPDEVIPDSSNQVVSIPDSQSAETDTEPENISSDIESSEVETVESDSSTYAEQKTETVKDEEETQKKEFKIWPIIIIGALSIAIVCVLVWYFMFFKKNLSDKLTEEEQNNETDC